MISIAVAYWKAKGLRLAGGAMATVLVDAENVRRSLWPNMPGDELLERSKAWGEQEGHEVQVVWEGSESETTRSRVSFASSTRRSGS